MDIKCTDSKLKVMVVLWKMGEGNALNMVNILIERIAWSKSTAYTVLQKCVDKRAIERRYPCFYGIPQITRDDVAGKEYSERNKTICGVFTK